MKFSALVLSLTLSGAAAFAPSASRIPSIKAFSTPTPVETEAVNGSTEDAPAPQVAEPVAAAVPVDLPVQAAPVVEEKKVEVPVAVAAASSADKIFP